MKKLTILSLLLCSFAAGADTCPSLADIHANHLGEWRAFDSNNGEPLLFNQLIEYEKQVDSFELAAYYDGAYEGPAQCYYSSKSGHLDLDVYLARYQLYPDLPNKNWKENWLGHFHCQASIEDCVFRFL